MSAPVIIVTDKETLQQIIEEVVSGLRPAATTSQQKLWFNSQEAAEYLGNHNCKEVIHLCKLGKLEHFRKGDKIKSKYYVSRISLESYDPTGGKHDRNRNKRLR
jgi:hypothetical protein